MGAKKKTVKKRYLIMDSYSNEVLIHGEIKDIDEHLEAMIFNEEGLMDVEVYEIIPMRLRLKAVLEKK